MEKENNQCLNINESHELAKEKILNSALIKELRKYKEENAQLKQDNEILHSIIENLEDENKILKSDFSSMKNQNPLVETMNIVENILQSDHEKKKDPSDLTIKYSNCESCDNSFSDKEMEQELETLRPLKDQLKTSQQLKSELESKLNKLEQNIQQKDQMWESLKNQKESLEKNLNELLKLKNEQVEVLNLELKSKSEEKSIPTVHEGHKDYKCESCGNSFSQKEHLKKHIHTVHKD